MKQTFSLHRPGNWDAVRCRLHRCIFFLLVSCISGPLPVLSQGTFEQTAPAKYRIEFTDKFGTPFVTEAPGDFLSQKAIERRQKQGIPVTYNDLPVTPAYLDSIADAGAEILTVSKWFNAATVQITDTFILEKISRMAFIKKEAPGIPPQYVHGHSGMQAIPAAETDYGPSWWQTAIHRGDQMHNMGYTGKDIVIAIIDAGFSHVDDLPAFERLWANGRILGTHDFVTAGSNVFRQHSHGMSVLSIIGGYIPGEMAGTAPDASFWLLRSEDVTTEYVIEEDNWIAAAEFADSAGVDIINTSLGYTVFYDSLQNHTYAQMNGDFTRISRAADIAASKGMLVVVSAGNEGNKKWRYISAPADADSVLTVGAVDHSGSVAGFSGRGPSSDQQVKPTVMAIGQGTYVSAPDGTIKQGNGTSYSAPVICGLAACLWQANRDVAVMDLFAGICKSADRFNQPNDDYGYGIPDFALAHVLLQTDQEENALTRPATVFPNPFSNQLYIIFQSANHEPVEVALYDLAGKQVFRKTYPQFVDLNYLKIENDFGFLQKGAYIIRVDAGAVSVNSKLIKF